MASRSNDRNDERGPVRDGTGISPNKVQKYLKGLSYPATKDELVSQARQNEAPTAVMHVIQRFPEDCDYGGPQDVMKAFGNVSNKP